MSKIYFIASNSWIINSFAPTSKEDYISNVSCAQKDCLWSFTYNFEGLANTENILKAGYNSFTISMIVSTGIDDIERGLEFEYIMDNILSALDSKIFGNLENKEIPKYIKAEALIENIDDSEDSILSLVFIQMNKAESKKQE